MRKEIPFPVVDSEELLVRGILHPMFCSNSKNKLKREAFLPPPERRDVSLLRFLYTDDDFCKQHSKSLTIPNNIYKGLATFKTVHVYNAVTAAKAEIEAHVKGTPIDINDNYIVSKPVYVGDPGLPMHADLLYSQALIKGEPNTNHRLIANELLKVALYYPDPSPETIPWTGEKLNWNPTVGRTG